MKMRLFLLALALSFVPAAYAQNREVTLEWQPNAEPDLAGYFVYRQEAGSLEWNKLNADPLPPSDEPSFTDPLDAQGVSGSSFYYAITAVDANGNESAFSTPVRANMPFYFLNAPGGLSVTVTVSP